MKRYLDLEFLRKVDLPPGKEVVHEGICKGEKIQIGETAFMKKFGVQSESEYKQRMMREKSLMFHAHIGLNSWKATAEALKFLYEEMEKRDLRIDRFGLCLDRAMGLPPALREKMPRETGPRLETIEQWYEVGQVVPIQPHTGDFMIGFPNSVENTTLALQTGITTIGNLSQYFAHGIPGWTDDVFTTLETVKALSILATLKKRGTLVHSYFDDGYGALFTDYTTVVGWVMIEKYIVEDLIGAKLSPCFGGMTSDPKMRLAWILVLKDIFGDSLIGSMFYGDTISYTADMDLNLGIVANYVLWDSLAQISCPTGHAITPIPVTEAVRVPSAREILQVQILGRKMEKAAMELFPRLDLSKEVDRKDHLIAAGRRVFQNALELLASLGIDIEDPVRLLFTLKKLGPSQFETHFGVGEADDTCLHDRKPVMIVDYYKNIQEKIISLENLIRRNSSRYVILRDRKIVITSIDVHEHALYMLERILNLVGMKVFNIGSEKNPDQIIDALIECGSNVLAISTHNGMAYEFAKLLKGELVKQDLEVSVFMGGRLNQNVEGEALPRDVTEQLGDLDINPCETIEQFIEELTKIFS